ncbi:hypothetical protein [Chamaesiphon sp.]|uniref:hypothetical protein n=1 Tax=Chamaesiphon sp. TaxID=2814140 RepID=UPI0035942C43
MVNHNDRSRTPKSFRVINTFILYPISEPVVKVSIPAPDRCLFNLTLTHQHKYISH